MKINPVRFYNAMYNILNEVTPLEYDCGTLCDGACCRVSDVGEGMYLYPREELMYRPVPDWAEVSDSDFTVDCRVTPFFSCDGSCDRRLRPLACRVFPLVPYIDTEGRTYTILDPRSIALCPLAASGVSEEFKCGVHTVTSALQKIPEVRAFLAAQSRLIDEYMEINNFIFNGGIGK